MPDAKRLMPEFNLCLVMRESEPKQKSSDSGKHLSGCMVLDG
jgi:hypothetical protein